MRASRTHKRRRPQPTLGGSTRLARESAAAAAAAAHPVLYGAFIRARYLRDVAFVSTIYEATVERNSGGVRQQSTHSV